MFTGIIEEIGVIDRIEPKENLITFKVGANKILKGTKVGDSVSLDGVCLTVIDKSKTALTVDVMQETLNRTTLEQLKVGSVVNLERALKLSDRLSGHFVTGHIDEVGVVRNRIATSNNVELHITASRNLKRYIVAKGSMCVDGVSLTIGEVTSHFFAIHLIPHTKQVTTLGFKKKGDHVNLEADILAKYVVKEN